MGFHLSKNPPEDSVAGQSPAAKRKRELREEHKGTPLRPWHRIPLYQRPAFQKFERYLVMDMAVTWAKSGTELPAYVSLPPSLERAAFEAWLNSADCGRSASVLYFTDHDFLFREIWDSNLWAEVAASVQIRPLQIRIAMQLVFWTHGRESTYEKLQRPFFASLQAWDALPWASPGRTSALDEFEAPRSTSIPHQKLAELSA